MYRLLKKLSIPLVVALFVTSIPTQALANQTSKLQQPNSYTSKPEKPQSKILGEAVEKRDKYTKHFIKDDLTYEAAVYPIAVHYTENGSWKDIDNSLTDSVDESNDPVLENKNNDIKVKFAKNSNSNKLVSIKKDEYKLSWNLKDALKTNAVVDSPNNDAIASDQKDNITSLKNLTSSLTYKGIQTDVDLQYILLPEEIKENIILSKSPSQNSFIFELDAGKLEGQLKDDGSISFVDPKTLTEIFTFDVPYMFDSNGERSEAIAVGLEKDKNRYRMTLTPDKAWLESTIRAYPVVIDPTVTTSRDTASISDTHVSSNFPTTINNLADRLVVGLNNVSGGSGINRAYMKFNLPTLTAADMVIDASLTLHTRSASSTQQQINAHRVYSDYSWDPKTLNWSNQVAYDGSVIHDVQMVKNIGAYTWNITTMAKMWYTSGINNGLVLKSNNENVFGYNEFYSSDISDTLKGYRPYLTISYVNASGLEDYWSYHSYNAGRAGTAYVNDYNGNLIFVHDDISMNGNRLPIALSHVFNSYERTQTGYGNGWNLNLAQTIIDVTIENRNYSVYTDSDGTKHYFDTTEVSASYTDESGLDLELTKGEAYVIKDKSYNQYTFEKRNGSSTRYLTKIQDSNGNAQSIEYNTSNRIVKVTDGAGRAINLGYNPTSGLLETITDPSGRTTRYEYNGINLETITYPDGKQSKYQYTASGNMTSATNHDGYRAAIEYNTTRPFRVSALKELNTDGTLGQQTGITYGIYPGINTFTDAAGTAVTYHFDNFGRTVSIVDNLGYVTMANYGNDTISSSTDKNMPPVSDRNKPTAATQKQQPVMNISKNSGAERGNSDWNSYTSGGSTGSATINTVQSHTGKNSFALAKSNIQGYHFYQQPLQVKLGDNYAIQAYIKTSNVSAANNQGAYLAVSYYKDGQWIDQRSEIISGTQDWTRVGVSVPVKDTYGTIYVKLILEGETGTAYFDTIQVEQSALGNAFNLIENGDFANGLTNWTAENSDVGDGIGTDSKTHPLRLDNNVLKITGSPLSLKKFNQLIPQAGSKDDVLVLGGWASGDAVYNSGNSAYKLTLEFIYSDGSSEFKNVFFNQDTGEWQFASGIFIANKDYTGLKVHIVYHYNGNPVMFDGIHLYKGNQDSIVYDSKGNITSSTDAGKTGKTDYGYDKDGKNPFSPTHITDNNGNVTEYEYDDTTHNLKAGYTTRKDSGNKDIKHSYEYDSYGNVISTEITNVSMAGIGLKTSSTYTQDGNYLSQTQDPSGNAITFSHDTLKGLLNEVTDPNGNKVTYEYEPLTDRLTKAYSAQMSGIANQYGYTGDDLTSISHNGFNYQFDYDKLGYLTKVSAAGQNLVTNAFNVRHRLLDSVTYGNSQSITCQYDAGNRLQYERTGEQLRFDYAYDAKGNLAQVGDYRANLWTKYVYDFGGKLTNLYDTWGRNSFFGYDNAGQITKIEENINGNKFVIKYQYGDFNNLVKVLFGTNSSVTYNYNEAGQSHTLGRLNSAEIKDGDTVVLNSKLTFEPGDPATGSTTSNRVSQIDNNGKTIDYTFDKNGNIKTITYEKGKANEKATEYFYDALNQLIRENNQTLNKTIKYNYDNGGNILSKEEYGYTDKEILTDPAKVSAYTYDSIWKDKLTSYEGKAITSDEIGNTTAYDGWTLTWDRGRELATMIGNGKSLSFTYNENGIRTTKTVDDLTTKYQLIGDAVAYETNGADNIYYTYGTDNNLISMNLNKEEYYYVRNAQNDIIGLLNSDKVQVASYTYDSWGKLISITDKDGNDVTHDTTHIGYKNPYRYRGYRYDNETGLYYLQSRYYNPEWGRFINADDYLGQQGELLNHNLFAYCTNNPVNNYDPNGYYAIVLVPILAVVILGMIAIGSISVKNARFSGSFPNFFANNFKNGFGKFRGISSSTPGDPNKNDKIKQLLKSKKSYEKLVSEHRNKLNDYKSNPYKYDNKGVLRNAPSNAIRQKIINGRIKQLESQIIK